MTRRKEIITKLAILALCTGVAGGVMGIQSVHADELSVGSLGRGSATGSAVVAEADTLINGGMVIDNRIVQDKIQEAGAAVNSEEVSEAGLYGAGNTTTGTLGDNKGITWTYDADTKTLTVTGNDSGLGSKSYTYSEVSPFESICSDVVNMVFEDCTLTGTLNYVAYDLTDLKTVKFINCDTTGITDMSYMFGGCTSLESVDMSGLDTSAVTMMQGMFYNCSSLTGLDLSGWDTSSVKSMGGIFNGCSGLTSLDLSNFDTSNVAQMENMFNGCSSLTSVDLSSFDTSKAVNMWQMFYNCSSLENLDVSNFDTSSLKGASRIFFGCSSLKKIDVSGFDTSKVDSMELMFGNCSSLEELDVSKFDTLNTEHMYGMFSGCSNIKELDVSGFDTSKVTNMDLMFDGCSSLASVDVSGFDTSKVTDMGAMFRDCSSLTSIDVSGFDTSKATTMQSMFYGCSNLKSIDVSNFDTSSKPNIASMFNRCSSLKNIDISGFKISGERCFEQAFYGCTSLETLDMSNMETSSVVYAGYMFGNCSSLKHVNLTGIDTENVKSMNSMFDGCSSLETLDLSDFDTSNVTNMYDMFRGCSSLKNLDLSSFDTSNVTDGSSMFFNCTSLECLDISSFDTSKGSFSMFGNNENLKKIYTPKTMAEGQSISLEYRYTYYDLNGNAYNNLTPENCNKLLLSDKDAFADEAIKLDKVVIKTCSTANGVNVLKWNPVDNAEGYIIMRKSLKSAAWEDYATVTGGSLTRFEDRNVLTDTRYYYAIKAYCYDMAIEGTTYSAYDENSSNPAGVITSVGTVELGELTTSEGSNTITWTPVEGVQGYVIKRKTDGGKWINLAVLKGADRSTYTDSKAVSAGSDYTYTIFAMGKKKSDGSKNYGGFDKEGLTVTASVKTVKLGSVYALSGKNVVKWGKVNGADGYVVYRKEAGVSKWTAIKTIKNVSTVRYDDKSVKAGTKYTYTVKAYYTDDSGSTVNGAYNSTGKTVTAK